MTASDVLIVGAGPTGLVLALWLRKLGVNVRIVDKTAQAGTTSRALGVQARTLELYRQLDLADAVVEQGRKVPAVNLWVKGQRRARVPFENIGSDLTPYPFLHIFPQDEHEKLLVARLLAVGVAVERETELLAYEETADRVIARLRLPEGREERCDAAYLAGCDGARSVVRHAMGASFAGGDYSQVFYVADVAASGPPIDGELHVDLDEADFLAVFPLAGAGRVRLVGAIRDERARRPETLKFDDVSPRAIEHLKLTVRTVNWFSHYHVHHRIASRFRKGRVFLLGDAAHIHSPVGGQGMNTGIGDAINLAWKLQTVADGRAPDALLDSYEVERIAFARRLVNTTDRVFTLVSSEGRFADFLRTRVAPFAIGLLAKSQTWRKFLFRTVSQVNVNYRDCSLNEGVAGRVRGGDRLPWVAAVDNHQPLEEPRWQIHVYGDADPALSGWSQERGLPLHIFGWRTEYAKAGLARNALYLVRPDAYVALASPKTSPEIVARYLAARGIGI